MYQTLYRKYRPNNLNEVVGQKIIVKTLKNAIINNKLSHAYLFTGPRGTGKTSIAKILARTINCTSLDNAIPCNKCINCTQNLNQPIDIIEIDAASNNGVDEIRELKSKVNLVPTINKYKVYIIDEVHMLTQGAFNALLKTLEEPPAHIIFILATTEPHKIPITILSRCQRFDFKRLNIEDIIDRLKYISEKEKIKIDDICLKEIARLSNGGMRDAISILDQVNAYSDDKITLEQIHEINGTLTPEEIKYFIISINDNNITKVIELIDKYDRQGKDFVKLSEEILIYLKNIIYKIKIPKYFETLNLEIEYYKIENLKYDQIIKYIENFNSLIYDLKKSSNTRLIFELNLIKIINNFSSENLLISKEITKKTEEQQNQKKIINKKETIEKDNLKIVNLKKIDNKIIKKISDIRINNTLCYFNKKEYIDMKEKIKEVNRLIIDPEYSQYAAIILDGELKASGKNNLIFIYNNEHDANIYNENLIQIDKMLNFLFNEEYKSIATDKIAWEKIKNEFNNKQKKYVYMEEPSYIIESLYPEKKEENSIEETFGNIVEYN